MTDQPQWKTIHKTDSQILQVDETGVYDPELTIAEEYDKEKFILYRFPIEQCFRMGGQVSDNKFHKDHVAWFGDTESLRQASNVCDVNVRDLISQLCSDDPNTRSEGYITIGSCFGYQNFDSYPRIITEEELNEIFND